MSQPEDAATPDEVTPLDPVSESTAPEVLNSGGLRESGAGGRAGFDLAMVEAALELVFSRLQPRCLVIALCLAIPASALAVEPIGELKMRQMNGNPFSLDSLKGQVVVLDFWASWCVPCRTSFPFLDALNAKYESRGLRVVGLTLEENEEAIRAFLEAVPVRFPVVRDPSGHAGEAFGVVAMPTTFLLDPDGRIAARFEGGDKSVHEKIDSAVATLLAGGSLVPGAGVRVARSLEATSKIKAWQRGYLADPIMNLDGDPITRLLREHVHSSKEGAAGDGGAAGGGCGCN